MKNLKAIGAVALVTVAVYLFLAREHTDAAPSVSPPETPRQTAMECPMTGVRAENSMTCPMGESNHSCCAEMSDQGMSNQGMGLHTGKAVNGVTEGQGAPDAEHAHH